MIAFDLFIEAEITVEMRIHVDAHFHFLERAILLECMEHLYYFEDTEVEAVEVKPRKRLVLKQMLRQFYEWLLLRLNLPVLLLGFFVFFVVAVQSLL